LVLAERITIGITTKDRWGELAETVGRLIALGLGDLPIIVVDDGSSEARAEEICKPLKNCTIVREPVSLGLVEERNRIAQLTKTDYLVSLDDDSCLEAPHNLDKAVDYMDSHKDVAVLAFWRSFPSDLRTYKNSGKPKPLEPIPVTEYKGCGHMLRVATFLELGGYRGYFHYMCEERDYSLRVYGSGKRIILFPDVQVVHRLTPVARSSTRVSFYGARNTLLCWLLNLPFLCCMWLCTRSAFGQTLAVLRGRQALRPTVAGILHSVVVFREHRVDRRPLSRASLNRYFALR